MSYISELRAERRHDQWAAEQIKQSQAAAAALRRREAADAAAQRRRADRDDRAARAKQRRDERRDARKAWVKRLPDHGMAALWATMIVLPISLAWQAQALFAHEVLRIAEPFNHAFPAAIETGAWLCAFEAHRRIRRGDSAGLLPTYMWVLAGAAAVINGAHGLVGHGDVDGDPVGGLALAVLSLLGVFLHSIRQGLDQARVSGNGHARLALWRRIRYPRLSIAAASLRAARELNPADAWQLAWVDRYGVGPDVPRRERQLARLAVRKAAREGRKAARAGNVAIVKGRVQKGFAKAVREHVDRERKAAMDQALAIQQGAQDALNAAALLFGPDAFADGFGPDGTTPNTTSEQGGKRLSARAAELLPALQEAIQQGAVKPSPSVKGITKWVREALGEPLGVPVAMELRDRVRGLYAVPADQTSEIDDREESVA